MSAPAAAVTADRGTAPRRLPDPFRRLTAVVAAAAPFAILAVVVLLGQQGWTALQHFGLGFLVSRDWNPVQGRFGALPFIYGTIVSSLIGLAVAIPVGVGVALFLAEPGLVRVRAVIGTGVELLAAIPSVVYGLWGLYVMGPWVFHNLSRPLSAHAGHVAVFSGEPRLQSMLAAGLVLAVMVLPTLAAVSRDVIKAVPGGIREASFALGATWWETSWKIILPAARAGIFGAVVLALGRALGETIAVTMVIGNRPDIDASWLVPAYTIASVIANEFTEATGALYSSALIALGLVLVLVTLSINLGAQLLVRRVVDR